MPGPIETGHAPIISAEQQAVSLAGVIPPLHSVLKKKEPGDSKEMAYLKWLKDAHNATMAINQPIAETQLSNLLLFQGVQTHLGSFHDGQATYHVGDETEPYLDPHAVRELTINELFDTVMQLSNKLSQFNITTLAVPHSTEESDREAARVTKEVLQTIKYVNNMVAIYRDMIKESIIMGESYIFPLWDRDKGDVSPEWLKTKKGPVTRIGDVCYKRRLPWEKGLEPRRAPEEVTWLILPEFVHIDDVKAEYPEKASKIKPTKDAAAFDLNILYTQQLEDHVLILELFGRNTKFMDSGFYMKATPDIALEGPMDNPYPEPTSSIWGNLPLERLTDIEIPGRLTPISTFQILAPAQRKLNQFYTQIAKNILAGAHLKMLRPKQGKISTLSFANTSTYIDYVHPYEPKMLTMNTVPPELFGAVELMQNKITQLQGLQPVTKGETGSEVRSAKQVDALRGIETVRGSDRVQKKNDLVVAVDRKTLAIIGKYYKDNEPRLLNIVGSDKQAMIKSFNVSALSKPYDVRLQPIDGLPEDPAERIRAVAQLMQFPAFAELYSREQWADILDIGTPEKFFDDTKTAVQKAEWENQRFLEGKGVPDVLEGDDHILHWRIHQSQIRSQNFLELSKKQQDEFVAHQTMHESIMVTRMEPESGLVNPVYVQQLATLSGFPVYFKPLPPEPAPIIPPQVVPEQGQVPVNGPQQNPQGTL